MIRPNLLQEYLEGIKKDFQEFDGIFLSLQDGGMITEASNKDKFFYGALSSLWEDSSIIAKLKLYGEDVKQPLQKCIIEEDNGTVILCGIHDIFLLGFCLSKDKNNLAYALQKVDLVKTALEKQLANTMIVQQKDQEQEQQQQNQEEQ